MEVTVECEFEYEVSGKLDSGKTISQSNQMKIGFDVEDYAEPEMLYSEAFQAVLREFWHFGISENEASYTFPADLTISIRNLTDVTNYGEEE